MTLLTVVRDVCAAVGVDIPTSVFSGINTNRTMGEMLALANEMSQRIAYDTREWGVLKRVAVYDAGTANNAKPVQSEFAVPADFQRLLLTANLRRHSLPTLPVRFIPDQDEWVQRRLAGYYDARGEWTILGNAYIAFAPQLFDLTTLPAWANNSSYTVGARVRDPVDGSFWSNKVGHTSAAAGTFAVDRAAHPTYWTQIFQEIISFLYLDKNCIALASGGNGNVFLDDNDSFRLAERLLKLGMIWQWKAQKGSPYAEDMASYETALAIASGADVPAPIIVGRLPISSSARVAYPWPLPTP